MATDVSFASSADLLLAEGDSGNSTYSIEVRRSGDLALSSSITWQLRWSEQDSHPTNMDFASSVVPAGTLSFAAGEVSKFITLQIAGDMVAEANERFYLSLNVTGAVGVNTSLTNYVHGEIVNDDDTVGNTKETAQAVSVNSYTNSAIEKVNDQDWYAVNLVAGQRYAIGLAGLSNGLLPTFQVLNASGVEVANVLDQTGMGVTVTASGTYYLKVQARAEGGSTGEYSLVVHTEGDDVAGADTTLATLATYPEAGGLIELISDNQDADWYQVNLTVGHMYRLTLVQPTAGIALGQNIGVQLLDGSPSHQALTLTNSTSGALNGLDVRNFTITPTASGTYYIDVSGTVADTYPGFYFVGVVDNSIPSNDNGYQIRALTNSVIEGDAGTTPYVFEVIRDNSSSVATVNWSVSGVGASPTDAADFSGALNGTLTFQAGEAVKRITVAVAGDTALESTETFKVTLSSPSVGVLANGYAQAYGTVRNDDGATGTADVITGSNAADTIDGGAGDDVIAARAGDDRITGGPGNDILRAGDGNDTLNGGAGNNVLDGGAGDDTYVVDMSGITNANVATTAERTTIVDASGSNDTLQFVTSPTDVDYEHFVFRAHDGRDLIAGYFYNPGDNGTEFLSHYIKADGSYDVDALVLAASHYVLIKDQYLKDANGLYAGPIDKIYAGNSFTSPDFATPIYASGLVWNGNAIQGTDRADLIVSAGENLVGGSGGDELLATLTRNGVTLDGGLGDDLLSAGQGNDVLIGGAGNDTLNGSNGYDVAVYSGNAASYSWSYDPISQATTVTHLNNGTDGVDRLEGIEVLRFADQTVNLANNPASGLLITGGAGNDSLVGGAGNDTLVGGPGNDTLVGAGGIDRIVFSGPITDYTITANPSLLQYTVADTVPGRDGTDTVKVGGEILQFANNSEYEIAFQSSDPSLSDRWLVTLSPGNDVLDFSLMTGAHSGSQITWATASTAGALPFVGNFSTQTLTTGGVTLAPYTLRDPYGGIDTVKVAGANSPPDLTFWSGPGNDYVSFAGNSTTSFIWNLSPTAGNDTVVGGTALATIDFFFDGALNIALQGNHGVLPLGPGASVDYTNVNRWRFWGGDFTVKASSNSESFEIWANNVQLDLSSGGADQVNFTGWKSSNVSISGLGSDDLLSFSVAEFGGISSASMLQLSYDAFANTTHVVVNARDGKVANIHLLGGQYQIDHLNYDPAYSWSNSVTFKLADPGRSILGTSGSETLTGGDGPDSIWGMAGNDTIIAGAGNDFIDPGTGSDSVDAGPGDDYIFAGGGDITYHTTDDQSDTIDGGAGTDWAVYDYRFQGIKTPVLFQVTEYGSAPVAQFTQYDPVSGKTDVLKNIEGIVVHGGEGNDVLTGSSRSDNFIGNDGNDTLYGNDGDDLLNGAGGNDVVYGGNGNDYIQKGGDGNDTIDGGAGNDTYQIGFDWVAGTGVNFQSSWTGNGTYVQSIPGGFQDLITGIEQIQIFGTNFNDTLTADGSNNPIEGLGGNDQLFGLGGNDTLVGGSGDDTLDGGSGTDTAIYRGNKSAYALDWNSSTVWVTDVGSGNASGHDTLTNVEYLQFDDQTVNVAALMALPPVTVAVAPARVNENAGEAMTYTFTRTGSSSSTLNFTVNISGSAQLGQDYDIVYPGPGSGPAISVVNNGPTIEGLKIIGNAESETVSGIALDLNGGVMLFGNSAAGSISRPMVIHIGSSGEILKTDTMTSVGGNTFINAGWASPFSASYFVAGQTFSNQIEGTNFSYKGNGDAFFGGFNLPGKWIGNAPSTDAIDGLTALTVGRDPTQFPFEQTGSGPNVLYVAGSTGSDTNGWNATISQLAATGDFSIDPSAKGFISWTRTIDSGADDRATGVATTSDGSVYVVGYTQASLDGQMYAGGAQDAFLVKYDAVGNKLWTRLLGVSGDDRATGIAANAKDGSVYVTGTMQGLHGQDAFVARVSAAGQLMWRQTIDSGADDTSRAIAADAQGNLYIGGSTTGTLRKSNAGGEDAYIARVSENGVVQWIEQGGTSGNDAVTAMTLSADGNSLFIGGQFGGAFGDQIYGGGTSDMFAARVTNLDSVSYNLTLTLAAGQTSTTLNVMPRGDTLPEADETVTLSVVGGGSASSAVSSTVSGSTSTTATASGTAYASSAASTATGTIVNDDGTVPSQMFSYQGHLYALVDGPTWELAEANAVALGGHLVTINDAQEEAWVRSRFVDGFGKALWIGLTDQVQEGQWVWASGEPASYRNWFQDGAVRAPDNMWSLGEDFAVIGWDAWGWNDAGYSAEQSGGIPALRGIAEINPTNHRPTGEVHISGLVMQGLTLRADNTLNDADGIPASGASAIHYQWLANGQAIGGAVNDSYTLTQAEVGKTISVRASYTDGGGTAEQVLSPATSAVLAYSTAPLQGLIYDWKSHKLLNGVNLHLVPQGDGVPHLYELRNTHLTANGDFAAEVWVNLGNRSIQNLDFSLALGSGISGQFKANTTSLAGFASFDGDRTDHVDFASASLGSTLSGSVLLGDLTLHMPTGVSQGTLNFESGTAGDWAMPSYSLSVGVQNTSSNVHGAYAFPSLQPGTYELSLDKPLSSSDTSTVAINSADALAALKLAVGRNPNGETAASLAASPYQFIAADINGDGKVTTADALAILKMVVKRSDAPSSEWLFVRENQDFWNEDTGKFTTTRAAVGWDKETVSLQSPITSQQNFVAVLKGDVNGSWAAPAGSETLDNSYFEALVSQNPNTMQLAQWGIQPSLPPTLTGIALV